MSREEPYFEGWSLDEALQRVGDAFRAAVEGRLIVLGRLDSAQANFSYFPIAELVDEFSLNQTRTAHLADGACDGRDVYDLRFFPVLKAPNVEDVLRDVPLKKAFELYVIGDPEVERLGINAVVDCPKLANVYFAGEGQLRYWPFNPDLLLEIGELEGHGKYFDYYPTARTHAAALALRDRLSAMIGLLKQQIYSVEGDPFRKGDPRAIPESQWLNSTLWFDIKLGDVVQERDWDEGEVDYHRFDDGRENYTVRWRAAMLVQTGKSNPRQRPPSVAQSAAKPKRIETTAKTARDCQAWLEREMRANPNEKQLKPEWLMRAQIRWSDLSERTFDRLWANSVQITRAFAWSASGPRKRSKGNNSPR